MSVASCNVLLIAPRFTAHSFWSWSHACEATGVGYPTAPLGLITVAALLPKSWSVRLIDRNIEDYTHADLDWADMVMTGGMLPQQPDMLELIRICRARGKPIVVGGADPTSSPHIYEEADFRVLGEAEDIIEQFIAAWNAGARSGVFEAEKFQVDVTRSPIPRFDLLKRHRYFYIGLQFSRGCPFNCEFCDIIELFGRVPRAKSNDQMLNELETLYRLGYRGHVDFVDDNLVGNKKALRKFLPDLIRWQRAHNYPFLLSTEASINLADDQPLLDLMRDANFFAMFVGIESPDTDTLVSMQKKQNTRRSLAESIQRIYQAGILVAGGFIVGFDSERGSVADGIVDCIEDVPLPICMLNLLYALPNTQLTRRLQREGRLHAGHDRAPPYETIQTTTGLNFDTARARRDVLVDFRTILEKIYHPAVYFARVRRTIQLSSFASDQLRLRRHELVRLLRLAWHMTVKQPEVRGHYWRTIFYCLRHKPSAFQMVSGLALFYAHAGPYSRYVIGRVDTLIAEIDAGQWVAPGCLPATSAPKPVEERRLGSAEKSAMPQPAALT